MNIKIPGNYQEARLFWADYIKKGHPDDSPVDIPNLGVEYYAAWNEAGKLCNPWSLNWSQDFDLLPDFKIGDKVDAGAFGEGEISFMIGDGHGKNYRATKAKIKRADGSRSVYINLSNMELIQ